MRRVTPCQHGAGEEQRIPGHPGLDFLSSDRIQVHFADRFARLPTDLRPLGNVWGGLKRRPPELRSNEASQLLPCDGPDVYSNIPIA